jgi:hypothetical protein
MSEDKPMIITYEHIEPAEYSKTPGYWPVVWVSEEEMRKEFPAKRSDNLRYGK